MAEPYTEKNPINTNWLRNEINQWQTLEVQSNFENMIRYGYEYPTKITVPSVVTGCNLIKN